MTDSPDQIGPYRLESKLGAGGMGEVFRAVDTRMGRAVALKILPVSMAADGDRLRRFEQEARLTASLNHPNIMAIYDVELEREPRYIVAELVPGQPLRAMLEAGALPVRKAIDIAAQIAAALAAAHTAGIVHRDLKPENVIITPEGVAKVLDFGIARMESVPAAADSTMTMTQTVAGSVVGTAAYMSPEQARAERVDYRSDQFALGLVLYEMLSGSQAFSRPSAVQTMSAIVEDDPPTIERAIPEPLRWILDRCLAKDRTGRYESTRDLARDLAQLRDRSGELTGVKAPARPAARGANRKLAAIVAAAAGIALILIALFATLRERHTVDLSGYQLRPLATALVMQMYPAWSPDGKSVAFLGWDAERRLQLYVQALDGASAVQVTPPEAQLYTGMAPLWSPDSAMLYFRCGVAKELGICRIPAGGGQPTMIQAGAHTAALSPDGRTLAIWPARGDEHGFALWTATPPEAPRQRYAPLPFQASRYYNNPAVRFAPDGRSILLMAALDSQGETAWRLPWPPGPGRRAFTKGVPFTFTPEISWLPDSRHLLLNAALPGRSSALYIADAANGRHWPVLVQDRPTIQPSASPDGHRAVYVSSLSHSDIISVPLGEGAVATVLGSTRREERVDASQAGGQLVYATDRRGVQEIWIKSLADGAERPLAGLADFRVDGEPAQELLNPVFSRDGKRVAISVKTRSGTHLFVMFVNGGTPVRATASQDLELCATWSPDGAWLAYSALRGAKAVLLKVRPGSGEAPAKVADTYGTAAPVWSPTGEWIADHDEKSHLVLMSPDGATQKPLPGDGGPVAWSRDGKTLYQVRIRPVALYAVDVASGRERKLRDLGDLTPYSSGSPGLSAALTWDEKSIVYAVNRPRTELWVLEGLQPPQPWYRRLFAQ